MIDNSAAMLAVAQRRLQACGKAHLWDVEQGNAFELEKLGRRFELVFTFRFIRHFREEDRARIYRAIDGCLEPGGLLLFDVVNKTVRQTLDARNPNRPVGELDVFDETYSPESFPGEMDKFGFGVLPLQACVVAMGRNTRSSLVHWYGLSARNMGGWSDGTVHLHLLPTSLTDRHS
jgi:SAM-dependent methyltransferase